MPALAAPRPLTALLMIELREPLMTLVPLPRHFGAMLSGGT
jgi:hypothetical protein